MATETYPGNRLPSHALIRFKPDGRVLVAAGTHEIGTGMYTIMTEVAADALGIDPALVDAELGDTNLPRAPISAGSMSTASVSPAIQAAAEQARNKLIGIAVADSRSPVHGASLDQVGFKDGRIFRKSAPGRAEPFSSLLVDQLKLNARGLTRWFDARTLHYLGDDGGFCIGIVLNVFPIFHRQRLLGSCVEIAIARILAKPVPES